VILLANAAGSYLRSAAHALHPLPRIRFIFGRTGALVSYTAHRLAVSLPAEASSPALDFLEQFRSFYFDTALSSSPSARPAVLAFARPERIPFGSDWPFAPAGCSRDLAALRRQKPGNPRASVRSGAMRPTQTWALSGQSGYQVADSDEQDDQGGRDILAMVSRSPVRPQGTHEQDRHPRGCRQAEQMPPQSG
jgi:hypothetical protein